MDVWRKDGKQLPYAPDPGGWTDEHYNIFTLVELALGNRKEVTPEEKEEISVLSEADARIAAGDPNWLDAVRDFLDEDDISNFEVDDDFFREIDNEQRSRGE